MSSLVKDSSSFKLDQNRLTEILRQLASQLHGRVDGAFVFGSAADGTFNADSDLDLILVKSGDLLPFTLRGEEFADLYQIYPKLDLLVYSQAELDRHLADSSIGFGKSVRLSMKPLF